MNYKKTTPMMEQYYSVKEQYPECLLFFRLGDFYELFFNDAVYSAGVLNIVLTKRGKTDGTDVPMCGIPAHSYANYVKKLVLLGNRVAICEQAETPEQAKESGRTIVQRQVTKIITRSNMNYELQELSDDNNFLLAIIQENNNMYTAFLDINTEEFYIFQENISELQGFLAQINPTEIILLRNQKNIIPLEWHDKIQFVNNPDPIFFPHESSLSNELKKFLDTSMFRNVLCLLFNYISETKMPMPTGIPKDFFSYQRMVLSHASISKLNLVYHPLGTEHTLLGTLNFTHTPMGKRLLRKMILGPLASVELIHKRQNIVSQLINYVKKEKKITWPSIDLQKMLVKILYGNCSLEDIYNFAIGLESAKELIESFRDIQEYNSDLSVIELIKSRLFLDEEQNAKWILSESISYFYNKKDEILNKITELHNSYIIQLKITSLKLKENDFMGIFFEIPLSQKDKIPSWFIHKTTLTNSIRYVTPDLLVLEKELEETYKQLKEQDKMLKNDLIAEISQYNIQLRSLTEFIAEIDVMYSFATAAYQLDFVKPIVDNSLNFIIRNGRHIVVERNVGDFVSNDTNLETNHRCAIITGPNMGGKSTYLKQNAIIAIMAQIGSFVPASFAHIGIVDSIYTRIGAEDDISMKKSTFMVEMQELSEILSHATPRSLLILDEIGRGTATKDGISIAIAVLEYIHDSLMCRCLFATHFYELQTVQKPCVFFLKTAYCVKDSQLVLLHKIETGVAEGAFGINIAKVVCLPEKVITRAEKIFDSLNINESKYLTTIK